MNSAYHPYLVSLIAKPFVSFFVVINILKVYSAHLYTYCITPTSRLIDYLISVQSNRLPNFEVIQILISWFRNFPRSGGKISSRLVIRDQMTHRQNKNPTVCIKVTMLLKNIISKGMIRKHHLNDKVSLTCFRHWLKGKMSFSKLVMTTSSNEDISDLVYSRCQVHSMAVYIHMGDVYVPGRSHSMSLM